MIFQCSSTDIKSPQVTRTLLRILANHNYTVIWMVFIHLPIFNSSRSLSKPLGTIPSAPITIGITITFMFYSFLSSLAMSQYLLIFSLSLIFTQWSARMANSTPWQVLFSSLIFIWSGVLAGIKWSARISKSQQILCISFSRIDSALYIYHLVEWSDFNILYNSQWITFPQSSIVLYSFCTYSLHSLLWH